MKIEDKDWKYSYFEKNGDEVLNITENGVISQFIRRKGDSQFKMALESPEKPVQEIL